MNWSYHNMSYMITSLPRYLTKSGVCTQGNPVSVRSTNNPIENHHGVASTRLHRGLGFGAEGLNAHACKVFGAGLGTGLRTLPPLR